VKIYSERFSVARGWHWRYERDCNANNRDKWLTVFRSDEPDVRFVAQCRKPLERELTMRS
jgi:hypothetical protein